MAATFLFYGRGVSLLTPWAQCSVTDSPLRVALLTSAYVPDYAHDVWADVSASEVAAGAGYEAGGAYLSGGIFYRRSGVCCFKTDPPVWTALTKTFRYGVLYVEATYGGIVSPLIGLILFDATPADITVTAENWSFSWHADGILKIN